MASTIFVQTKEEDGMKLIVQKVHIKSMFGEKFRNEFMLALSLYSVAGAILLPFSIGSYIFSFLILSICLLFVLAQRMSIMIVHTTFYMFVFCCCLFVGSMFC